MVKLVLVRLVVLVGVLACVEGGLAVSQGDLQTSAMAVCDARGQAVSDLVVASNSSNVLRYVKSVSTNGTMTTITVTGASGPASAVVCGDFRALGFTDIAAYFPSTSSVYMINGLTFAVLGSIALPSSSFNSAVSIGAGDVNGDGLIELVVASGTAHVVSVYNGSNYALLDTYSVFGALSGGLSLDVGDVNGDAVAEVIVGQVSGFGIEVMVVNTTTHTTRLLASTTAQFKSGSAATGVHVRVCASPANTPGFVVYMPWNAVTAADVEVLGRTLLFSAVSTGIAFADQVSVQVNGISQFLRYQPSSSQFRIVMAASQMSYVEVASTALVIPPPVLPAFIAAIENIDALYVRCSGTETTLLGGGTWYSVVQPPCIVAPQRIYTSPYVLALPDLAAVTFDFAEGARGNKSLWGSVPYSDWFVPTIVGSWGPQPAVFSPPVSIAVVSKNTTWIQERYLAVISSLVGWNVYQHHHIPVWVPNSQVHTWAVPAVPTGAHFSGLDCSDLTSWGWNYGFGLHMTSLTAAQAALQSVPCPWCTTSTSNGSVLFTTVATSGIAYSDLVTTVLQPGDMLYIKGEAAASAPVTHVLSWLGNYASCKRPQVVGPCPPLILDSHGQVVVDSVGITVPTGPHIRPFLEDSWYFQSFSHAVRLVDANGFTIKTTSQSSTTSSSALSPTSTPNSSLLFLLLALFMSAVLFI
eukprot:ANDGO_07944.mRNA.1 hypothetical protein